MGGFLRETKKELQDSELFWILIIIHDAFSIEESLGFMDQLRSFLELDRYSSKLSILFFGDFYSVGKDSFRISNGKNQEIGNNGSKVDSKEEYYIQ